MNYESGVFSCKSKVNGISKLFGVYSDKFPNHINARMINIAERKDFMKNKRYQELFDDKSKIEAFDEIAKAYYDMNFGTMQKSDFEVLMFSIYIEQILKKSEDDFNSYSDYTLSKELGITQNRINMLKQKKELKYPKADFDWKSAFEIYLEKSKYVDNKIKIYIPDPNVYLEIKNVVEMNGGIVDVKRNRSILQLSPADFIEFVFAISNQDENERDELRKLYIARLKNASKENQEIVEAIERKSFNELIIDYAKEGALKLVFDVLEDVAPKNVSSLVKIAGAVILKGVEKATNKNVNTDRY